MARRAHRLGLGTFNGHKVFVHTRRSTEAPRNSTSWRPANRTIVRPTNWRVEGAVATMHPDHKPTNPNKHFPRRHASST